MNRLKRETIVNAVFGMALVILAAIAVLYYRNVTSMTEFDRMVELSHAVAMELDGLLSDMKEVENGEHLFTITGEEESLAPYRAALGRIDRRLAVLKERTQEHPEQRDRLLRAEPLIREKLALAAATIDVRRREGYPAASRRELEGPHKRLLADIRRELTVAREAVAEHLNRRKELKEASTANMLLAFFAGNIVGFALLISTFLLLRREIGERKRAEQRFRGLLESAPDAMVIVDAAGDIRIVNSESERLFGYRREELIGQKVEMLIPERFRQRHEVQRTEYVLQPRVRNLGAVADLYGLDKEGREFPVDISLSPLDTDEGVLIIAAVRDIGERKRMEETLRFSEARYRTLFRDNPVMIVTLDAGLTMLSVNPICASLLGYAIDELEGQSVLRLFHESDRPAVAEQLQRCLENPDQVYRWQFRKVRKDGVLLWVEETAQAVYDLNGTRNLLVVCQDISERRRMEDELRRASMRNELILASAGEGIVGLDLEGTQLFVNAAAAAMLGYDAAELVGKHSHSTWHYARPDGAPYPPEKCPVYAAYKEGVVHSGEETFWRKDGTPFPVEFTSRPMFSDTEVVGAVLTFNDITARKRTEAALRNSEEKLFKIFHSVPALIAITTLAEGKFVDINDTCQRILGFPREEMIGKTSVDLGIWESREARERMVRALEQDGRVRDMEVTFRRKDGAVLTGLFSADLIEFDGQQYMLSMVNDITDRKRMEEEIERLNTDLAARAAELEAANRELEAFSYTVAHDLRKPLTVVNGYCQALRELCGDRLGEECGGYLEEAYNGTWRMNRLIEALLSFSHLAHVELCRETVDISKIAQETAIELRLTDPGRQVTFKISDGIAVDGDASLLRVVLTNLLDNAWKYTRGRENAFIEFGVVEAEGKRACFVRDNGPGFDMADAGRIFTPFLRLPGAGEFKGFGIGLATVERIVKRHGGRVWAEGEPGKGATFYFSIGRRQDDQG